MKDRSLNKKQIEFFDLEGAFQLILENLPSIEKQKLAVDEIERLQKDHSMAEMDAINFVLSEYLPTLSIVVH